MIQLCVFMYVHIHTYVHIYISVDFYIMSYAHAINAKYMCKCNCA